MLSVGDIAQMIIDEYNITETSDTVIDNEIDDVIERYFIEKIGDCLLAYTWMEELVGEIKSRIS